VIEYEKNKLPDVLVLSELLHGPMYNIRYDPERMSPLEAKIDSEREIIDIVKSNRLTKEEKLNRLAEKHLELLARRGTNNIAKNLRDLKEKIIIPYALPVLDKGGEVIHVAGNHANATFNIDEGELLSRLYGENETKYLNNKQLQSVESTGQRYALGHVRLRSGELIYVAHKLKRGSDEMVKAFEQLLKIQTGVDVAGVYDAHHPMIGISNKIIGVLAPGNSGYTSYVDMVEKTPSFHGIINLYRDKKRSNTAYKYSCLFELILDQTITKEEYMGKRKQKFMVSETNNNKGNQSKNKNKKNNKK
jgi:hypothetical protein